MRSSDAIEPIPEDWDRVRDSVANARDNLMALLVRHEARKRVERERLERRRRLIRRHFPFRRAA